MSTAQHLFSCYGDLHTFCPSRAVEREITKYGTMWTQATIGWKTICGTASRIRREQIWVSNPGVTGARPQKSDSLTEED